jgi:muramoyltetrapeptide carboxypeptidase LdcA involved in peptidoglycan recycling
MSTAKPVNSPPHPLIWPPPLRAGDAVAVAMPASAITPEAWQAGVQVIEDWGYRVISPPDIFKPRPWGQAADREAARRFMEVWEDPER